MLCFVEDVIRADIAVMGNRMVLGVVVTLVAFAGAPVNVVLFLVLAVADPEETYVKSFGTFLLESVVGKTNGCCVVALDRCGGLLVA